jgi:nucleotide-binding universal stress UspA family protein
MIGAILMGISTTVARKVAIALDLASDPGSPWRLGAELAQMLAVPALLVTVLVRNPLMARLDEERERRLRTEARDELLAFARRIEGVEVSDALALTAASPARALQELTERADVAAIVVGSTARERRPRILAGSVVQRLVSGAACPVAVAPHGYDDARPAPPRVGVAFDASPESVQALEAGSALARRAGAALRVITASPLWMIDELPDPRREALAGRAEMELRAAHDAAVVAHGGEGAFVAGEPAQVLAEHSADLGLLVTGSRGYGPLGAVLVGSTTFELLRSAACPLLILPRGRDLLAGS